MEPQDLSGSWGTPIVPLPCSLTPARPRHHRPLGALVLPPLVGRRRLSRVDRFRGSITRLWHLLSTLHGLDYSSTGKTRFRLPAKLCRAGLITRRVPTKGFSYDPFMAFSFPRFILTQPTPATT